MKNSLIVFLVGAILFTTLPPSNHLQLQGIIAALLTLVGGFTFLMLACIKAWNEDHYLDN